MRLLLNILWFVLGGGFVIGLEYLIGGLVLCLTIVGIPFGLQCFKIGRLGAWPFGRAVESEREKSKIGCALNVFWLVVAGVWIFASHVVLGAALAVTIIGIPFAIQHLKLAFLALAPFGQRVRVVED